MNHPTISIVIPTRNRPDTLARVLQCIKSQSYDNFECLVIDDDSDHTTKVRYDSIWRTLDDRFILHPNVVNGRSFGPGKTRNVGIRIARGTIIAFCDDDDMWIKNDHLSVSVTTLQKYRADLFLANMQTSANGNVLVKDWFTVHGRALLGEIIPGENDIFYVTIKEIGRFLSHRAFHADMIVAKKELIETAGMYYENVYFGEDLDFAFRLVDNAKKIAFRSTVVVDLNVSRHPSIARSFQMRERLLFSVMASLRAETQIRNARLRRIARTGRAWQMVELARLMKQEARWRETCEFATQAFLVHPSMGSIRLIGEALLKQVSGRAQERSHPSG